MVASLNPVKIVMVGHVDHGKSTFIGRLLFDTGHVPADRMADVEKASRDTGRKIEYAFLMDQFQEEREANITIDTSQTFVTLADKPIIFIDAPGHKEYLKNMITGATQADHAFLLLDIKEGIREQTDKHARILRLLNVGSLAVMINKMDLADYSEAAYNKAVTELKELFGSLNMTAEAIIPICAYEGENVARRSVKMPWYHGPTALEFLLSREALTKGETQVPFVMPVQLVHTIDGNDWVLGRVESGAVMPGQFLYLFPGNKKFTLKKIGSLNGELKAAHQGDSTSFLLDEKTSVVRGQVLTAGKESPATSFTGEIFWASPLPLTAGLKMDVECRTQSASCVCTQISSTSRDDGTLELREGDVGEGSFTVHDPLLLKALDQNESLARVVFHRLGEVVGCAVITNVTALALLLFAATPARAYIDPGTGVTFVGGVLAWVLGLIGLVFGALAFTFKRWFAWIKSFFNRTNKE